MTHKLLYILTTGILHGIARLPLDVLYVASNVMYWIVRYGIRYRKDVIDKNLRASFPQKSIYEIKKIRNLYYRHLCDCIVETVKLFHITDEELSTRIEVCNASLMEEIGKGESPVILFLGHYGNWEWVPFVTWHYQHPSINGQIYRPLRNKVMDKIMLRLRSRFGTISIPQKKAFRTLLKMKAENPDFLIGFIADQRPNSSNLNHWTQFLHQPTAFAAGGEEIGQRIKAHYVYLEVEKTGRGHYKMTFKEIRNVNPNLPYPYTCRFLELLEENICRKPELWLWSHNRWKFAPIKNI